MTIESVVVIDRMTWLECCTVPIVTGRLGDIFHVIFTNMQCFAYWVMPIIMKGCLG